MVLYCLTPPRFPRYSSLNLCPPRPALGENDAITATQGSFLRQRGITLVNRRAPQEQRQKSRRGETPKPGLYRQLTTTDWPML